MSVSLMVGEEPPFAAHIVAMTSNMTPSAKTPTKPVLMIQRIKTFLVENLIVVAYLTAVALLIGGVSTAFTLTMTHGEEALQTSISMSEEQLTDAGLDELNSMRQKIDNFNEGGGGTPAVNERELDRIDAVVLEVIDAQ